MHLAHYYFFNYSFNNSNSHTLSSSSLSPSSSENSVTSSVSTTSLLMSRISGAGGGGSVHRGGGPGGNRKNGATFFSPTLGYAIPPPQPAKVARRNARERNRVKQVNGGFDHLRKHIPSAAKHKKMSKVDTLRHAVDYIQNLQQMLNSVDETPAGGKLCISTSGAESNDEELTSADSTAAVITAVKSSPSKLEEKILQQHVPMDEFLEQHKQQLQQQQHTPNVPTTGVGNSSTPANRNKGHNQHNINQSKPPPLSFHGQQPQLPQQQQQRHHQHHIDDEAGTTTTLPSPQSQQQHQPMHWHQQQQVNPNQQGGGGGITTNKVIH